MTSREAGILITLPVGGFPCDPVVALLVELIITAACDQDMAVGICASIDVHQPIVTTAVTK